MRRQRYIYIRIFGMRWALLAGLRSGGCSGPLSFLKEDMHTYGGADSTIYTSKRSISLCLWLWRCGGLLYALADDAAAVQ